MACEPIQQPEDAAIPGLALEAGDRVPSFELRDTSGRVVTEKDLVGRVTIITFMVSGSPQAAPYLRRLEDTLDRLGPAPDVARLFIRLPGSLTEQEPAGWTGLAGEAKSVSQLANRFAVLTWSSSDSFPHQTFAVAVIGPDGRLVRRFGGLQTWDELDLIAAVADAGRNPA